MYLLIFNKKEVKKEVITKNETHIYMVSKNGLNLSKKKIEIDKKSDKSKEYQIIKILKSEKTESVNHPFTIKKSIIVNAVNRKKDMVTIDFSSRGLQGEAAEESLLIDSIVLSMTEFKEIKRVQFLIDGKKKDTLLGAFLIWEPITRDDVTNNIVK